MEKYTFEDWQSGKTPPKGWDCADAVDDGWTKGELETFMRQSAVTTEKFAEFAYEQWPELAKATPAPSIPAGPEPRPVASSSQAILAQLKQTQQEKPQEATVTDIRNRVTVPAGENWKIKCVFTKDDEPKIKPGVAKNWAMFLLHHEEMRGVLGYDEFAGRIVLVNRPPWEKGRGEWTRREIVEVDTTLIVEWLETQELSPKFSTIHPVLERVAREQSFHPVRDYLAGLPEWDGVPRLDGWLVTHAGVTDTKLNRAFARKVLCAAVRRMRQPGCKFDHVLVLAGPENLGKSRLIRALSPNPNWLAPGNR